MVLIMNARSDDLPKRARRWKNPDLPYGVYLRDKPRPYIVKFARRKGTIYVGSFTNLADATAAAKEFRRKELAPK